MTNTKPEHDEDDLKAAEEMFEAKELQRKMYVIGTYKKAYVVGFADGASHARSRPEPELGGYRFEMQGDKLWMRGPDDDGFQMSPEMLAKIFKEFM